MENPPLLSSFAQKCAGDLMQIKALIKLVCNPLASWRIYLDHSHEEICLHRESKSLKSYGGQPKKKLIPSLVFQKVSIRDLVLVPWPKARLKDTSLILIICTHQSTLIIWSFCENSIVRATS